MISINEIEFARQRIAGDVLLTPCAYSEKLSQLTGCELYLKLENLQKTGSFKDRGALNRILSLSDEERGAGIIAASAGNHAQGVAHAARIYGLKCIIVMPETTPLSKVNGTRELGADIVLHGAGYDDAFEEASRLRQEHGYTLVHAFDDEAVIAGQGTIGLELLEQVPDMDAVIVPVGGGGLISGIATAIKAKRPDVELVGVESEHLPAMQKSVAAGEITPVETASTISDGIAVRRVGRLTMPIVRELVSRIVTVSEEETAAAIMLLLEREKTLAEGAGAVGLAALYYDKLKDLAGKKVVVVISGGNIDMKLLSRIVRRGLEHDGRLCELRMIVPDKPGSIARVATVIAGQGANIYELYQRRRESEVALGERAVVLQLETRGHEHIAAIIEELRKEGIRLGSE
ncbi:MAG: threonine ammonia-lyase [Chromatiales bacterium]|jgi:threonine dehydratase